MSEHKLVRNPMRTLLAWVAVVLVVLASFAILNLLGRARESKKAAADSPAAAGKPTGQTSSQGAPEASPAPVVTVTTHEVTPVELAEDLTVTGTIAAVDPLAIGSEVGGLRVQEVLAEEGDWVTRGQVLARLNSSILEAQIAQAEARLQSSLAQISKAAQPNRPQDIAGLRSGLAQARAIASQERANLRQAEANLAYAQQTSSRYGKVLSQGFVTSQEAQDKQAEVDRNQELVRAAQSRVQAADFSVEQARQRLLLAEAGGRQEDVQIAQAQSTEIAALVQQLNAQLDQTVIRAPDDGQITKRDIHVGEISSNSKAFFTMARKGELELRGEVPQVDLLRLKEGERARVTVGGKSCTGKIWRVSPVVDPTSRLGTARILLPPRSGVMAGMFARASLHLGTRTTLAVPTVAVLGEGGDYFVYLLGDKNQVKRQPVKTGLRTNEMVEVTEGLAAGDRVVVRGAGFLTDGDSVEVKAP